MRAQPQPGLRVQARLVNIRDALASGCQVATFRFSHAKMCELSLLSTRRERARRGEGRAFFNRFKLTVAVTFSSRSSRQTPSPVSFFLHFLTIRLPAPFKTGRGARSAFTRVIAKTPYQRKLEAAAAVNLYCLRALSVPAARSQFGAFGAEASLEISLLIFCLYLRPRRQLPRRHVDYFDSLHFALPPLVKIRDMQRYIARGHKDKATLDLDY